MPEYSSFVIKIWTERDGASIRGRIQHVGTEKSVRFIQMEKMVEFILGQLNPPPADDQPTGDGQFDD